MSYGFLCQNLFMKVLLAGATGAIGSPLIGKLLAAGHAVFGMTQSSERAADLNAIVPTFVNAWQAASAEAGRAITV